MGDMQKGHWYKGMLEDDVYTDGLSIENIDARQTSRTND